MTIIDSGHSLSAQGVAADTPVQGGGYGPPRSSYCYLFENLANKENDTNESAGIFPGSSPENTLARLKDFEAVYRGLDFPLPPRMGLPPVYTYFGQFLNHDISAPVGGLVAEAADIAPAAIMGESLGNPPGLDKQTRATSIGLILERILNEHGAPLTLDSLYADGPKSQDTEVRSLYRADGMRFALARAVRVDDVTIKELFKTAGAVFHPAGGAPDLQRKVGKPLIADRRNDENLILSQLHLAFMLLHNKAVDALHPQISDPAQCFKAARLLITHHYQWCVVNDYLKQLLTAEVLEDVLRKPSRLGAANAVPMEFTVAAFRFGHSMVSSTYDFNANFGIGGALRSHALLQELFVFTSRGGMLPFADVTQLPDHWVADWDRLTRPVDSDQNHAMRNADQPDFAADSIDMNFAVDMLNGMTHGATIEHASIFYRNLIRGFHRRMPFGQDLARAYDLFPLTCAEVQSALPAELCDTVAGEHFDTHTPAWLYFLCEAQVKTGGKRLGPAASYIIADTIIGLLKHNENSVLGVNHAGWHPNQSILKTAAGQPLDSIRALLMFATA